MKKVNIFNLLILILLSIPVVPLQIGGWYALYATPDIAGIHAFDTDNAIAVGSEGFIIKLKPDYPYYDIISGPTDKDLASVYFIDATTGWTVGEQTILKTEDGGVSWTPQYRDRGTDIFHAVFFADADKGWAAGENGVIMYTATGGTDWDYQNSGITNDLFSVYFVDANTGWAVGEETILKTDNGGISWTPQYRDRGTDIFYSVSFTDADNGWAAGESSIDGKGVVWHTTNGGTDWDEQKRWGAVLHSIHALKLVSGDFVCWAVGRPNMGSKILSIYNDDVKWNFKELKIKTDFTLHAVSMADESNGWVCGTDGIIFNVNYNFDEYGEDEESDDERPIYCNAGHVFGETKHELESVCFHDATTGWIVGEKGTIIKTEDGGDTWIWQNNERGPYNEWFLSASFINDQTGFVCGTNCMILKTTNGGVSWDKKFDIDNLPDWKKKYTFPNLFRLESIYFVDATNGWAVGEDGLILNTTNGGDSWTPQPSGTDFRLESVFFSDANHGWIVGCIIEHGHENRRILKTTNGGSSWNTVDADTKEWLTSVYSPNGSDVYAVGSLGSIIKSENAGNTWTEVANGYQSDAAKRVTPLWLEGMLFTSDEIGYAVGGGFLWEQGIIIKTENSGSNWIDLRGEQLLEKDRIRNESLLSAYFINEFTGWAVGNKGSIIKTTTGGISPGPGQSGWLKNTSHEAPPHSMDY